MDDSSEFALDKLSMAGSGACAAHCLFVPVLAFASPTLSSTVGSEWVHKGLLLVLIPLSLIAFYRAKKVHHQMKPVIFGIAGVVFLLLALLVETLHMEISYLEQFITCTGSILLIYGHLSNIKFSKMA